MVERYLISLSQQGLEMRTGDLSLGGKLSMESRTSRVKPLLGETQSLCPSCQMLTHI